MTLGARNIYAADLFAGCGGTTTGLIKAARRRQLNPVMIAINHSTRAMQTHTFNHPQVRHLCESLENVDPVKEAPSSKLDILAASPECTNHSRCKSGKPLCKQSRAGAYQVWTWADATNPDYIVVENVKEWKEWGPLTKQGRPDKRFLGRLFNEFCQGLENRGYHVRHDVLTSADYGDPTTRERLILQAWKRRPPTLPEPTHRGRWRPAYEVIDWSIPGTSIWSRKKPLVPNTMRRIMRGLYTLSGLPFTMPIDHKGAGDRGARSMELPLSTITTEHRHALVQPWLVNLRGTRPEQLDATALSIGEPLPTITAGGGHLGLCQPFIIGQHTCSAPRPVTDPLPTVACAGAIQLVQPMPYLIKFYGTGAAVPITRPLDTITTKSRFGLGIPTLEIDGERYVLDILFRMLRAHELKRAMGFDEDYFIVGNVTDQIRQIGNAVSVGLSTALFDNIMNDLLTA